MRSGSRSACANALGQTTAGFLDLEGRHSVPSPDAAEDEKGRAKKLTPIPRDRLRGGAPADAVSEPEWRTRKSRIDPKLQATGWPLFPKGTTSLRTPYRTEEEETDNGPADYPLWLDRHVTAIVEAKKVQVGAQEVLRQAERYARGLRGSPYAFGDYRCPFLYATNAEIIWFRDVRDPLNLSRQVAAFHTPSALREMLDCDFDGACERLRALSNEHNLLRP